MGITTVSRLIAISDMLKQRHNLVFYTHTRVAAGFDVEFAAALPSDCWKPSWDGQKPRLSESLIKSLSFGSLPSLTIDCFTELRPMLFENHDLSDGGRVNG